MVYLASGLRSCVVALALMLTTELVSVSSEITTICDDLQYAQANISTIVYGLALGDNQEVTNFINSVQATNATKGVDLFDLYQCTYKHESVEVVVKATAICVAGNKTKCVSFAEFRNKECLKVELCPYFVNDIPSFTADCSGIITEYFSCKLTCSNDTSEVTGMEQCVDVPNVPAPTDSTPVTAPTDAAPVSAPPDTTPVTASPTPPDQGNTKTTSGSGLAAIGLWRVGSALCLVVLGHFAFQH